MSFAVVNSQEKLPLLRVCIHVVSHSTQSCYHSLAAVLAQATRSTLLSSHTDTLLVSLLRLLSVHNALLDISCQAVKGLIDIDVALC